MDGTVALVTGGASGIGRATVERLAAEGAAVVAVDVDEVRGAEVAAGAGARFVGADVADPAAWERVVSSVLAVEGALDVAVLNAGVVTGEGDLRCLTDEQYRRVVGVNVDGVVFGARAAARVMSERGGGAIVATASLAGLIAFPPDPIYTLTKHAVVGLVRSLEPQLSALGIRIHAICPGLVETPLLGDDVLALLTGAGFPLIPPAQVADAVVAAIRSDDSGRAWVCQPGRDVEVFEFGQVPGAVVEGGAGGVAPPGSVQGRR